MMMAVRGLLASPVLGDALVGFWRELRCQDSIDEGFGPVQVTTSCERASLQTRCISFDPGHAKS